MIVKIGNTYHYSTDEPILLILSNKEKEHIANLGKDKKKYLSFPSDYDIGEAKEILNSVPELILECVDYIDNI